MNMTLIRAAADVAKATEYPDWLVCVIGVGIVFVGLISLILICSLMGVFFRSNGKKQDKPAAAPTVAPTAAEAIPNRQEVIAAVSAAIAEELGTDVAGLKILSIRRM